MSRRDQILEILAERPRDTRAITAALGVKVTPGRIGGVRTLLTRMAGDGLVECLREDPDEPGVWVLLP